MGLRLPFLILSLLFAVSAQADLDCSLLLSIQRTSDHLEENSFATHRDFEDYRNVFGQSFVEISSQLKARDVWIDFGAGEAIAQLDYLERYGGRSAKAVAVGFKRPPLSNPSYNKTLIANESSGRFQYLEGDVLESTLKLSQFSLGTDLYGPASYTHQLSEVLNRYFSLMIPNRSRLYLLLDVRRNAVVQKNGPRITIGEWLAKFPELKVERFDLVNHGDERLEITVLKEGFALPPLELISFKSHKPPHRLFRAK